MPSDQDALQKLCNDIIKEFALHITDYVFLTIEDDKALLKRYLDQIAASRSLKQVNSFLGNQIKEQLNVGDAPGRGKNPRSKLIQSYKKHKLKKR